MQAKNKDGEAKAKTNKGGDEVGNGQCEGGEETWCVEKKATSIDVRPRGREEENRRRTALRGRSPEGKRKPSTNGPEGKKP